MFDCPDWWQHLVSTTFHYLVICIICGKC